MRKPALILILISLTICSAQAHDKGKILDPSGGCWITVSPLHQAYPAASSDATTRLMDQQHLTLRYHEVFGHLTKKGYRLREVYSNASAATPYAQMFLNYGYNIRHRPVIWDVCDAYAQVVIQGVDQTRLFQKTDGDCNDAIEDAVKELPNCEPAPAYPSRW